MLRRIITRRHDVFPRSTVGARRYLHLAPPFLLDDYTPRYMALTSIDESKKRSKAYAHLSKCNLCPRLCGVNRFETTGMCLIGNDTKVNVIAPHFGEGLEQTSPSHPTSFPYLSEVLRNAFGLTTI